MQEIVQSLAHYFEEFSGNRAYACYNSVNSQHFIQVCHKDKPGILAIYYIDPAILDKEA